MSNLTITWLSMYNLECSFLIVEPLHSLIPQAMMLKEAKAAMAAANEEEEDSIWIRVSSGLCKDAQSPDNKLCTLQSLLQGQLAILPTRFLGPIKYSVTALYTG